MEITVATSFVQVTDADAALAFYRDALGLAVYNDVAKDDFRWITIGSSAQPGVTVVLTNYVGGSPDDVQTVAGLVAKGAFNGLHLHASDLDAAFAQARDWGAEVVSEPATQPWGVRDCALRDPSGNLIRMDQLG